MPPRNDSHDRYLVQAQWLVRLRWFAAAGQLATLLATTRLLGIELRAAPLWGVIAGTALTNVGLQVVLRRAARRGGEHDRGRWLLGAIAAMDLLSLAVLLYFTGGPSNPFIVFYFVNLALAAVILPTEWAWAMCGVAGVCIAALFIRHVPVPVFESTTFEAVRLRRQGQLVALVACAVAVTYFITRVSRALRQREFDLQLAERKRERSERLEALATLAAGAGHELASPLSTIAVVAKELAKHLEGAPVPTSVLDDVRLIRSELDHCRVILDRMSGRAGQAVGEEIVTVTLSQLAGEILEGVRQRERVQVEHGPGARTRTLRVPLQGLAQAVRGVVQNALDATPEGRAVRLLVEDLGPSVRIGIRDEGAGMSAEVLARAGEPFFTTKETGKGMGLGLFLTRNVVERLGGELSIESTLGAGTKVTIELPG